MINEVEKYYDLNDPSKEGPRGFVFAYDEDGNLLFHQENMITETGRRALMQNGFDKDKSTITKVVLGNSEELTKSTDKDISVMVDESYLKYIEERIDSDAEINNKVSGMNRSKCF